MRFADIPEAACPERKYFAQLVDVHFDWLDCWFDCENDFEHFKGSIEDE